LKIYIAPLGDAEALKPRTDPSECKCYNSAELSSERTFVAFVIVAIFYLSCEFQSITAFKHSIYLILFLNYRFWWF